MSPTVQQRRVPCTAGGFYDGNDTHDLHPPRSGRQRVVMGGTSVDKVASLWGGHIADAGLTGASTTLRLPITGSPYHMRFSS